MPGTVTSSKRPVRHNPGSPSKRQKSTSRKGRASATPETTKTSTPARTAAAQTAMGACPGAN